MKYNTNGYCRELGKIVSITIEYDNAKIILDDKKAEFAEQILKSNFPIANNDVLMGWLYSKIEEK